MKKISLVIPCYNEEEMITLLHDELKKVSGKMMSYAFEFIFVDDGSSDATVPELKKIAEQDSRVVFIELSRNFGKEAAMYAGLCNASGDYVAIMDADMQDPPSLLPEMTRLIEEEGYDSVATRRATRKGESKIRSFFARRFYSIINRISDADIVDGARDFRLMKRDMVDAVIEMSERNRFSKGIFGWVGYKTKWLEYENVERAAGETKWSFWSLVKYSIDGIVNFSNAPLAIASFLGIIFTIVAFLAIVFIIVRKFIWGDPVAGWPSLVCIITLLSGTQMFCIGIIGQYLSKTYMEVKQRPHYIIRTSNKNVDKVN